ncbi:TetR/AcrR family transcriptional regulator [Oscillochloris sp. ZM17-4]|uniref:TetR/AcrR family transcriptional regulator n=1 Tax=Oscillochloris sp. ZM17-4 TaxID=2866714 RepID=UPI001C7350AA|nr:TetR/AcrR family transcriptional regulator [Oscillochloris sp. ZM17-4]MBX0331098.1 TetR/AcrR family transcriptional regulator [Oscillochloris sp. ZM17-4]
MSRPSLKERQRQLRESAILDAAHELMAQKGYAAMSIDDVAGLVGISKATIYQHFASKEDLAISVVVRLMQRGEQRMQAVSATLPAIQRLEEMMRGGLTRRAGLWGTESGMLPLSLRDHPAHAAQRARMLGHVSDLIDAAKAEGDIDPGLATPVVARTLAQLFQTDYSDLAGGDEDARRRVAETLVRLVFDGLRARGPR